MRSSDLARAVRLGFASSVFLALPALPSSSASVPPEGNTHGHWVQLAAPAGGPTVAYARVIVDSGFACPSISGGSVPVAMTPRDNPYHFPVQVCEAAIGFAQALAIELADTSLALPTVRSAPSRVLVMGDSGCKLQAPGSTSGCPAGSPAEPFATLAKAAAAGLATGQGPAVLLHMGDYNYRGTGSKPLFTESQDGAVTQVANWTYDAGDGMDAGQHCGQAAGQGFYSQSSPNANAPDSWQAWNDDFFSAAGPLLAAAPWVFARGNHELCSRAGPGWFYFLDPSSNLAAGGGQLSCPAPDPSRAPLDNVVLGEPYAVDLGSLILLVVDSANACDSFTDTPFTVLYAQQMAQLAALAPAEGTAWWMSHRPLWGVTGYTTDQSTGCTDADAYGCINQMLQAALTTGAGGALPASVRLVLAGHMHRFQSVTFPEASRPPVVVVGNSGVELDGSPPVGSFATTVGGLAASALATGATVATDGATDGGSSKAAFAYLRIDLAADGSWQGALENPAENLVIAHCGSQQLAAGSVCVLAPGVRAQ